MNIISIKNIALGLALTATAITAKAQKVYTEGTAVYTATFMGNTGDQAIVFKGDTNSLTIQRGPATVKIISAKGGDYLATVLDVPVASMHKYAIGTPAEIDEAQANEPVYAFTKTDETKKIGDYTCKKFIAKDTRDGKTYDLWITNDIKLPPNAFSKYYTSLGGTPVQFTYLAMGDAKYAQPVVLKSVSEAKVPADAFKIPAGFDKMSLTDMQAMGKSRQ